MELSEIKNSILGCWMGKNIGGTLGAPFEGSRGIIDIEFYTQDLNGKALPNDDLDLQLVWLAAAEKYGRSLNASILGEYWLSCIIPDWAEYGYCKNNMRNGIIPPLSGSIRNVDHNSNGAWIRSEIWACLAPGHPDIAAGYAYEDACVDHSEEGIYSAVFCASLQSAAFVESRKRELIRIGLSYIPENCATANAVLLVCDSFDNSVSWSETRKKVLQTFPSTFFARWVEQPEYDVPFGEKGFDAPSNIAIFILGWLYGEDDFGRSLCIAAGCGEDADCTAATLGATLGIMAGIQGIPQKWIEPIGHGITTACINLWNKPETVEQLTDRVLRLIPRFLDIEDVQINESGCGISMLEKNKLFNKPPRKDYFRTATGFYEKYYQSRMHTLRYETPLYLALFSYDESPLFQPSQPIQVSLRFFNKTGHPITIQMEWTAPEVWTISPERRSEMVLSCAFYTSTVQKTFMLLPPENAGSRCEFFLTVKVQGRPTRLDIPVTLFADTCHDPLYTGFHHEMEM